MLPALSAASLPPQVGGAPCGDIILGAACAADTPAVVNYFRVKWWGQSESDVQQYPCTKLRASSAALTRQLAEYESWRADRNAVLPLATAAFSVRGTSTAVCAYIRDAGSVVLEAFDAAGLLVGSATINVERLGASSLGVAATHGSAALVHCGERVGTVVYGLRLGFGAQSYLKAVLQRSGQSVPASLARTAAVPNVLSAAEGDEEEVAQLQPPAAAQPRPQKGGKVDPTALGPLPSFSLYTASLKRRSEAMARETARATGQPVPPFSSSTPEPARAAVLAAASAPVNVSAAFLQPVSAAEGGSGTAAEQEEAEEAAAAAAAGLMTSFEVAETIAAHDYASILPTLSERAGAQSSSPRSPRASTPVAEQYRRMTQGSRGGSPAQTASPFSDTAPVAPPATAAILTEELMLPTGIPVMSPLDDVTSPSTRSPSVAASALSPASPLSAARSPGKSTVRNTPSPAKRDSATSPLPLSPLTATAQALTERAPAAVTSATAVSPAVAVASASHAAVSAQVAALLARSHALLHNLDSALLHGSGAAEGARPAGINPLLAPATVPIAEAEGYIPRSFPLALTEQEQVDIAFEEVVTASSQPEDARQSLSAVVQAGSSDFDRLQRALASADAAMRLPGLNALGDELRARCARITAAHCSVGMVMLSPAAAAFAAFRMGAASKAVAWLAGGPEAPRAAEPPAVPQLDEGQLPVDTRSLAGARKLPAASLSKLRDWVAGTRWSLEYSLPDTSTLGKRVVCVIDQLTLTPQDPVVSAASRGRGNAVSTPAKMSTPSGKSATPPSARTPPDGSGASGRGGTPAAAGREPGTPGPTSGGGTAPSGAGAAASEVCDGEGSAVLRLAASHSREHALQANDTVLSHCLSASATLLGAYEPQGAIHVKLMMQPLDRKGDDGAPAGRPVAVAEGWLPLREAILSTRGATTAMLPLCAKLPAPSPAAVQQQQAEANPLGVAGLSQEGQARLSRFIQLRESLRANAGSSGSGSGSGGAAADGKARATVAADPAASVQPNTAPTSEVVAWVSFQVKLVEDGAGSSALAASGAQPAATAPTTLEQVLAPYQLAPRHGAVDELLIPRQIAEGHPIATPATVLAATLLDMMRQEVQYALRFQIDTVSHLAPHVALQTLGSISMKLHKPLRIASVLVRVRGARSVCTAATWPVSAAGLLEADLRAHRLRDRTGSWRVKGEVVYPLRRLVAQSDALTVATAMLTGRAACVLELWAGLASVTGVSSVLLGTASLDCALAVPAIRRAAQFGASTFNAPVLQESALPIAHAVALGLQEDPAAAVSARVGVTVSLCAAGVAESDRTRVAAAERIHKWLLQKKRGISVSTFVPVPPLDSSAMETSQVEEVDAAPPRTLPPSAAVPVPTATLPAPSQIRDRTVVPAFVPPPAVPTASAPAAAASVAPVPVAAAAAAPDTLQLDVEDEFNLEIEEELHVSVGSFESDKEEEEVLPHAAAHLPAAQPLHASAPAPAVTSATSPAEAEDHAAQPEPRSISSTAAAAAAVPSQLLPEFSLIPISAAPAAPAAPATAALAASTASTALLAPPLMPEFSIIRLGAGTTEAQLQAADALSASSVFRSAQVTVRVEQLLGYDARVGRELCAPPRDVYLAYAWPTSVLGRVITTQAVPEPPADQPQTLSWQHAHTLAVTASESYWRAMRQEEHVLQLQLRAIRDGSYFRPTTGSTVVAAASGAPGWLDKLQRDLWPPAAEAGPVLATVSVPLTPLGIPGFGPRLAGWYPVVAVEGGEPRGHVVGELYVDIRVSGADLPAATETALDAAATAEPVTQVPQLLLPLHSSVIPSIPQLGGAVVAVAHAASSLSQSLQAASPAADLSDVRKALCELDAQLARLEAGVHLTTAMHPAAPTAAVSPVENAVASTNSSMMSVAPGESAPTEDVATSFSAGGQQVVEEVEPVRAAPPVSVEWTATAAVILEQQLEFGSRAEKLSAEPPVDSATTQVQPHVEVAAEVAPAEEVAQEETAATVAEASEPLHEGDELFELVLALNGEVAVDEEEVAEAPAVPVEEQVELQQQLGGGEMAAALQQPAIATARESLPAVQEDEAAEAAADAGDGSSAAEGTAAAVQEHVPQQVVVEPTAAHGLCFSSVIVSFEQEHQPLASLEVIPVRLEEPAPPPAAPAVAAPAPTATVVVHVEVPVHTAAASSAAVPAAPAEPAAEPAAEPIAELAPEPAVEPPAAVVTPLDRYVQLRQRLHLAAGPVKLPTPVVNASRGGAAGGGSHVQVLQQSWHGNASAAVLQDALAALSTRKPSSADTSRFAALLRGTHTV